MLQAFFLMTAQASTTISRPEAFWIGVAGAFLVYFSLYRETRFAEFVKDPGRHWNVLAFDLVLYLLCGGIVAAFWGDSQTVKEALTTGCAWQGIVGGAVAGTELKVLRDHTKKGKEK